MVLFPFAASVVVVASAASDASALVAAVVVAVFVTVAVDTAVASLEVVSDAVLVFVVFVERVVVPQKDLYFLFPWMKKRKKSMNQQRKKMKKKESISQSSVSPLACAWNPL